MSLYGGIKRIDDTVFKFDKIYRSRDQMDQAASNDGVHVGRYVLVEYGERYHKRGSEQIENKWEDFFNPEIEMSLEEKASITKYFEKGLDYYPPTTLAPQNGYYYGTITNGSIPNTVEINVFQYNANSEPLSNWPDGYYEFAGKMYADYATIDSTEYANTYDSTVWQKIYNGSIEKYIMVAELNAMIPKLEVEPIDPLKYTTVSENDATENLYAEENKQIILAKEDFVNPSFDQIMDTELTYKLKMPKPLELKVDEEHLDYNRDGFNIVYSLEENETSDNNDSLINFPTNAEYSNSYIHWISDGLDLTNDSNTDNKKLNKTPQVISSKTLDMKLPVFGEVINDLYNVLFGKGTEATKWVRPYFQEAWTRAEEINNADNGISYTINEEEDFGKGNDNYKWLENVSIGDILGVNNIGLATILKSLFGIRNPLTEQISYYLKTSWDLNIDKNNSFINNKPLVVTTSNGMASSVILPSILLNSEEQSKANPQQYFVFDKNLYIVIPRDHNNRKMIIKNIYFYDETDAIGPYYIDILFNINLSILNDERSYTLVNFPLSREGQNDNDIDTYITEHFSFHNNVSTSNTLEQNQVTFDNAGTKRSLYRAFCLTTYYSDVSKYIQDYFLKWDKMLYNIGTGSSDTSAIRLPNGTNEGENIVKTFSFGGTRLIINKQNKIILQNLLFHYENNTDNIQNWSFHLDIQLTMDNTDEVITFITYDDARGDPNNSSAPISEETKNKVIAALKRESYYKENFAYNYNYPGHYQIDYDTWTLFNSDMN